MNMGITVLITVIHVLRVLLQHCRMSERSFTLLCNHTTVATCKGFPGDQTVWLTQEDLKSHHVVVNRETALITDNRVYRRTLLWVWIMNVKACALCTVDQDTNYSALWHSTELNPDLSRNCLSVAYIMLNHQNLLVLAGLLQLALTFGIFIKDIPCILSPIITPLFLHGAGLLDEASSGADDVEVLSSSRARLILSRLAVVSGVLLLVGILIAIRLFVHVEVKTDWAALCIPTTGNATHPPSIDFSSMYSNVTLAPCNETIAVHLPPTVWSAYANFWVISCHVTFP